jgi:hypothetical protein
MVFVTRELLVSRLHHIPGQSVVYLNNAKAACSTVKASLWQAFDAQHGENTYGGRPHQRAKSPFLKSIDDFFCADIESILAAEWFSVVRNPFVRMLSAYLDKIPQGRRDPNVWRPFKKRFRVSDHTPTFSEFLEILLTESVPDFLDWHFCPQTTNLLHGLAPLTYVGQLEAIEGIASWLTVRGIRLQQFRVHATNAEKLVEQYYGPVEVEAVLKLCRTDFDVLGYSRDPSQLDPIRPVMVSERQTAPMRLFLLCFKAGPLHQRRAAYDELAKLDCGAEFMEHLWIDAGLGQFPEIMAAFGSLKAGNIRNWRTAIRIGQILSQHEMVPESAKALEIACNLMYPNHRERPGLEL